MLCRRCAPLFLLIVFMSSYYGPGIDACLRTDANKKLMLDFYAMAALDIR